MARTTRSLRSAEYAFRDPVYYSAQYFCLSL
jgi:hypothetical protein